MPSRRIAVSIAALISAAVIAVSCSSGSSSRSDTTTGASSGVPVASTDAPTTTVDPALAAQAYTEPGEHPVGVTTLQLSKGPKVEVWYPAVPGTAGTDTYDMRDYVPPAVKALLTADVPAIYSFAAGRDAKVADGAFPVVLFSHGFAGIRQQSTFLTAHLASYGMIVVAPEHPSRDLLNVLGGTMSGNRTDSVDDLLQSLDLIIAAGSDPTSPFNGHVDGDHVAALGHSAGGGTALGAAADPRVDGYVSMSSGVFRASSGTNATSTSSAASTTVAAPLPDKPSFFLGGSVDGIAPVEQVTRPAFEAVGSPSLLWVITGAGHNAFDDFCTFGNGQGIIGVALASGLGDLLDAQPQIKQLGQDGCLPPAVDVHTTFPIVKHAVTAWLRWQFGIDATPVGLDASVADQYATPVEIVSK
jgi:predicted dienelactone hydrolase